MKLAALIQKVLERRARSESLFQLQGMSTKQLEDCGISPELLAEGVKAWPWRAMNDADTLIPLDRDCFKQLEANATLFKNQETLSFDEVIEEASALSAESSKLLLTNDSNKEAA